jgi:thioredoxin 1
MQFGIRSMPTLLLFKNGQTVERLVGAMPKERLLARIRPHLQSN